MGHKDGTLAVWDVPGQARLFDVRNAHALAWVTRAAGTDELPAGSTVLLTLSGRGDKDVDQVMGLLRRSGHAGRRET